MIEEIFYYFLDRNTVYYDLTFVCVRSDLHFSIFESHTPSLAELCIGGCETVSLKNISQHTHRFCVNLLHNVWILLQHKIALLWLYYYFGGARAVRHRINRQKSLFSSQKKTAQKVGTGTAQYSCFARYDGRFFLSATHFFLFNCFFFSFSPLLNGCSIIVYGPANARCCGRSAKWWL